MTETVNIKDLLLKIGRNFKTYRESLEIELTSIASSLNIEVSDLEKLEAGKLDTLSLVQITELCNYLKIPLALLLGIEGTQIFNYSQNNYPGSKKISQKNDLSEGYEMYINHLLSEIEQYKTKLNS